VRILADSRLPSAPVARRNRCANFCTTLAALWRFRVCGTPSSTRRRPPRWSGPCSTPSAPRGPTSCWRRTLTRAPVGAGRGPAGHRRRPGHRTTTGPGGRRADRRRVAGGGGGAVQRGAGCADVEHHGRRRRRCPNSGCGSHSARASEPAGWLAYFERYRWVLFVPLGIVVGVLWWAVYRGVRRPPPVPVDPDDGAAAPAGTT
jgi:hypothetical protein